LTRYIHLARVNNEPLWGQKFKRWGHCHKVLPITSVLGTK